MSLREAYLGWQQQSENRKLYVNTREAFRKAMDQETKTEEDMEPKKPRGKQPKPVVQIDPKTLQVVKEWPSMTEAQRLLGVIHVDKAVAKLQKAGGYYWSLAADAGTFKERLDEKQRETDERQKQQAASMREKISAKPKAKVEKKPKNLVDKFAEEQRAFEQMKREGKIAVEHQAQTEAAQPHNAASDALKVFTDEELIAALTERGWQGELTRVQRITIGRKEE